MASPLAPREGEDCRLFHHCAGPGGPLSPAVQKEMYPLLAIASTLPHLEHAIRAGAFEEIRSCRCRRGCSSQVLGVARQRLAALAWAAARRQRRPLALGTPPLCRQSSPSEEGLQPEWWSLADETSCSYISERLTAPLRRAVPDEEADGLASQARAASPNLCSWPSERSKSVRAFRDSDEASRPAA